MVTTMDARAMVTPFVSLLALYSSPQKRMPDGALPIFPTASGCD
jgi:hypothetical protein